MTVSAVRVNFELRRAFASCQLPPLRGIVAAPAAEPTLARVTRVSPTRRKNAPLGGLDPLLLLLLLPAQESRPARLQGFLHVHVRAGKLASPLEDLGVLAVTLEQPLAHAQR